MKKVIVALCLLYSINGYSQKGGTIDTPDQYSWGYSNGCQEGIKLAYSVVVIDDINNYNAFDISLNSILNNPSISAEYKLGYEQGMYACRETERLGDGPPRDISDWAKCELFGECK